MVCIRWICLENFARILHTKLKKMHFGMYTGLPRPKGLAMTSRIDCHDFFAMSLLILLSLRGAKRRSNPEKENVNTLDCFATLAMTGELIAVLLS